jgi:hypothetical protein
MRLTSAARKAVRRHIAHAVSRVDPVRYRQEPNYVAALFAKLDDVVYRGRDLTIEIRSTVVDDRGRNSAESIWGADFGLIASIRGTSEDVEKGTLGQAKRDELEDLDVRGLEGLRSQIVKMSRATRATLVLPVPREAGVVPNIYSVFPVPGVPYRSGTASISGYPGDIIMPRNPLGVPVLIGEKWALDDYICDSLIRCLHGDSRPEFVRAIGESDLATLRIDITQPPHKETASFERAG